MYVRVYVSGGGRRSRRSDRSGTDDTNPIAGTRETTLCDEYMKTIGQSHAHTNRCREKNTLLDDVAGMVAVLERTPGGWGSVAV